MGPITTSSSLSDSRNDLEQGFTPTSSSGGQIQIFNIEAYCKLCNKEFCNKYFLKTHMANKHGIYSDSQTSQSGAPRFEGGSMSMGHPAQRFPGSLASPPVSISGSFLAMSSKAGEKARDCPTSLPPGILPQTPLPPPRESPRESSEGSGGSRPQSNNELRSPLPSPIRPGSTPASQSPKSGPPPLIPGRPASGHENGEREMTAEDLKRMEKEMIASGLDMTNLPAGIRLPMVPSMSPFGGPMHFDSLLKMNPLSPMDAIRKESEHGDKDLDKNRRPIPNVPTLDRLRQMGVINADAFCEFCCKEFCNKYFLRVHKLKKHGVYSPELRPENVQKILQQMAKEAGKTWQPMPPLTMGAPSAVRPPGSIPEPPRSMGGPLGPLGGPFGSMGPLGSMGSPLGGPLNLIRPPTLPNFLNLPPLDGIPTSKDDGQSSCSSDRQEERDEARQGQFTSSPRSMIEPECELKIDENASIIKSPLANDPEDHLESSEEHEQRSCGNNSTEKPDEEPSEGLANMENMIRIKTSRQQCSDHSLQQGHGEQILPARPHDERARDGPPGGREQVRHPRVPAPVPSRSLQDRRQGWSLRKSDNSKSSDITPALLEFLSKWFSKAF